MIRGHTLFLAAALLSVTSGWQFQLPRRLFAVRMVEDPKPTILPDNVPAALEAQAVVNSRGNPCSWQDIYDDDCSLSNVYAASYIASDWIKSMPCGAGIADCDMPEGLKVPNMRPEAEQAAEEVDVMDFLGLKRAVTVTSAQHSPSDASNLTS